MTKRLYVQTRNPAETPATAPREDLPARWQSAATQFSRLAGIVEAGRVRLGAIAVSQEAAAMQIEAAEHALGRLTGDVAGLLPKRRG